MKKSIRVLALVLSVVMMLSLVACGETNPTTTGANNTPSTPVPSTTQTPTEPQPSYKEQVLAYFNELATATAPGLNTYESSWEDMVAHLTANGVIAADAAQVDMLTTPGYLKMYDGTFNDTYAFADKAVDFGGVYLMWWNLAEPTAAFDCYTGMLNNGGTIVVMGGMYTVPAVATASGSYAIAFAEGYDEAAKTAALDVFNAIDKTAYSLKYMTSTTDLAMALMQKGLLAATDIAGAVDLNSKYEYPTTNKDWVGYEQSEDGWGEPYATTAFAKLATNAYQFGNVTILYYAAAERAETSYYPNIYGVYADLLDDNTAGAFCQLEFRGEWSKLTVDAEGAYSAEGEAFSFTVDALTGGFAIIVNE